MEVGLLALWLPILVSTILVFVTSFLLYMVLPHHRTDFDRIEDEERFSAELQSHGLKKGQYIFPYFASPIDAKDPDYQERVRRGPIGILTVGANQLSPSAVQLMSQFVYFIALNTVVAYIAGQTLPPGAEYMTVYQLVGATALIAYAGAHFAYPIWYHFKWSFAWKAAADAILISIIMAGVFAWLWPM